MNAPAKQKDLAPQSAFQMIAVADIAPSDTHIQQLRRHRFDTAALAELVKSVTAHGVLQPIVVRAAPHPDDAAWSRWEIVAGERRWLAARAAKLQQIPAVCRTLTDLQVLEIQLIENLQREGLHPLEEAEGFADLMQLKGVNADAIAETIGRSRSHVFGRLKLLDLIPAAREAFNKSEIDASKAQMIARIPVPKLQEKALKIAQERDWRQEQISFRDFKLCLGNGFTVELVQATFKLNDAALDPKAGTCIDCPKRTGNLGDLFADVKNPDVCTDPPCFEKKGALLQKRLRAEAEAKGRAIITQQQANTVFPVIELDEVIEEDFEEKEPEQGDEDNPSAEWLAWAKREEDFQPRTYRQLLGQAAEAQAILLDTGKVLREVIRVEEIKKLLKPTGFKLPPWVDSKPAPAYGEPGITREEQREAEEKERERRERESEYRCALAAQIHAKFKGPLKREDLATVAFALWDRVPTERLIDTCYGGKDISLTKLSEQDLTRLIVELTISECIQFFHTSPAPLLALAKRCKIDPAKVKKDLAAAAKAKDKPEAAVKAPAKKKAAKK